MRRQRLHTRCGELEREWEVVEAPADLGDVVVRPEVGRNRARSRKEEADALLVRERRYGVLVLAAYLQPLAAGDQYVEPGAGCQQPRHVQGCVDDLLEVVEKHEHRLVSDVLREAVLRAQRLARGREHELRIAQRRERNPPDAVRIAVGEHRRGLRCQSCLSGAARTGERQQARVVEQSQHLGQLLLAAEERCRCNREVRLMEALQRREVRVAELVDALGRGEILEPVRAEVAQLLVGEEPGCRSGDEDLPPVTCGGDARGAVDIRADIALVRDERRS